MRKNRRPLSWKIYAGFVLFFSVLLYTSFISLRNARQLVLDVKSVDSTYAFMHQLNDLALTLSETEANNNSFVLIGKAKDLKQYQDRSSDLTQKLENLSHESEDKRITKHLKDLIQQKISDMNLAVSQREAKDINHALQVFLTNRWQTITEEISAEMKLNFEQHQKSLTEALSNKTKSVDETILSISIVSILGLVLFGFAAFLIMSEIKLRMDYEQQLENTSESKSMFLASMSHEIRTPMNGVLGMSSLLLQTPLNDKQAKYAAIIESSSQALLRIINDILDVSKVEAGKLEIISENYDLKNLLSEMEFLFSKLIKEKEKNIKINFVTDSQISAAVKGDSGRMRQILNNLIGNAIKFTEQGSVTVTCKLLSAGSSTIRFEIVDSGIGMSPEEQTKVFGSFEQASSRITKRYGGTGLGLSISKKLVEAMNGKIGMSSQAGKGSTFWFELDLPKAEMPKAAVPLVAKEAVSVVTGRKTRVLAADDDKTNLIILRAFLPEDLFDLDCVSDGQSAFEMFEKNEYDLVLMDVQMPIMDGLEAMSFIRRFEKEKNKAITPIIALTGGVTEREVMECHQSGCSVYLAKPLEPRIFLSTVNKCLIKDGVSKSA